jgi:peptidoglycan/LPS O-acetylase OafA/YrhL
MDNYGHLKSLDGLRAYAIIIVMIFHLDQSSGFRGGFLGVDIFFVISGFLITSLLIGEHDKYARVDLRSFYARRALRLLPALAIVIAVSIVLVVTVPDLIHSNLDFRHETLVWLPAAIFFVGNWPLAHNPIALGILGHTWSLAIEEQFYLVWPFLFLLLFSRLRRSTAALVLAGVALIAMLYEMFALHSGWTIIRVYFGTDTHCSGLMAGCALAFLIPILRSRIASHAIYRRLSDCLTVVAVITLVLMLFLVSTFDPVSLAIGMALAVVCASIILFNQITTPLTSLQSVLESAPARWIGKRSYGLYIWHYGIYQIVLSIGFLANHPFTYGLALCVVPSFAVAALSYRYIEQPVLRRWKTRFQRTESLPELPSPAT